MSKNIPPDVLKKINTSWLKTGIDDKFLINPLDMLRVEEFDDFEKRIAWLLSQPDYFSFLCKHIFNIELIPMQAMILKELWIRKFPMLIASRGAGKALKPDTPILTPKGWVEIKDIEVGDTVYGSDGKETKVVGTTIRQKDLNFYRISLRDGRVIDACEDHMWKIWDKKKNHKGKDYELSELSTKKIAENYFWVRKDSKSKDFKLTKEYRFALPLNKCVEFDSKNLKIHPYVVGVLLGDGSITTKTISFYTDDIEIVDRVSEFLPVGYKVSKSTIRNTYGISRSDKTLEPFYKLLQEIGIHGLNSHNKFIPKEYLFSSEDQRLELLKGLMDTDGCSSGRNIEYYTISNQLSNDFMFLSRSLGFQSKHTIKESWIGDTRYTDCNRIAIYTNKPIFSLKRKLDNYIGRKKSLAGESKYEKTFITNIEKIENSDGYCIQVDNKDHTYITKDFIVTHNSFILSLYCMLRAFLMPGRKIVVVGAAFRQSKVLYEYMDHIWKNAPVLRDLCDQSSGCFKDVDMCKVIINGSRIICLPIGDGCLNGSSLITSKLGVRTLLDSPKQVYGNGKFRDVEYFINNGKKPTKIVTTKSGYKYEATHNHAMKILSDNKIVWGRTDEMKIGDRILIDRSERWHSNLTDMSLDEAYSLGAMIGDGCWTNKYTLGFATKDQEIIDRINLGFSTRFGEVFKKSSDGVHWNINSLSVVNDFSSYFGLKEKCYTIDKSLPDLILSSSKECMTACLQGLFDTDGHVFTSKAKGGISASVHFTNTSETLVRQIQYVLLHYGIISKVTSRQRKTWNRVYELGIYGSNAALFSEKIGFYLPRKKKKLEEAIQSKVYSVSFGDSISIDRETVISASIKSGLQKSKILRLKSYQFNFLEIISDKLPDDIKPLVDRGIYYDEIASIEDSECDTYDIHVPENNEYCANGFFSHNSKIRGQRANDIISDEHASSSREIFENVIAGFAAVSASPVENVKREAMKLVAKELGYELEEQTEGLVNKTNQIIISGTAFYDFNHFAEYWKKWRQIILTNGNKKKISEIFNGEVPDAFDWRDYSIIRIPVDLVPKGFMDEGQIARSKATIHTGIYQMEFGAVFSSDSQGFFKRSLIESCVGTDTNPILLPSGPVFFDPMIKGNPHKKYIMGVDPASEIDNFSIILIELNPDHRRIVHCWTTNRKDQIERVRKGLTTEDNFYTYCARRIRDLMGVFNVVHISIDSQGGGIPIYEALHDSNALLPGEIPIWEIIDPEKDKPSDDEAGLHIIELCNFASAEWTGEANHGLRKDFEDKILIFPRFDTLSLGISSEEDNVRNRLFDTLEDCVMEIEELKSELSIVEISKTPNGRDRWDTPEVKIAAGKKKRLRKDRYSSLVMANMAARNFKGHEIKKDYVSYGGFAITSNANNNEADYIGPNWFTSGMRDVY